MSNTGELRKRLGRLKGKAEVLSIEMKGAAREICGLLDPLLNKPADMDIARADMLMDSLLVKQAELLAMESDIADLEEELG